MKRKKKELDSYGIARIMSHICMHDICERKQIDIPKALSFYK